jgi:hypothetical protein
MYAKIKNGQVAQYPYSSADLRRDNPNTSFSIDSIPASIAAEFGAVPVQISALPAYNRQTQCLEESTPISRDNQWFQNWVVVDLSQEKVQARSLAYAQQIRHERNQRISDFEPRILKALRLQRMGQPHEDLATLDAYVQALADLPQQAGFPYDIQWPQEPSP